MYFKRQPRVDPRGGRWQLGLLVQHGGLRRAHGKGRTSSRATPRTFSRTKDGSRRCSLSRDSNIGVQESNRNISGWPGRRYVWSRRRT